MPSSVIRQNLDDASFRGDLQATLNLGAAKLDEWASLAIEWGSLGAVHGMARERARSGGAMEFAHLASFLLRAIADSESFGDVRATIEEAVQTGTVQLSVDLDLSWLERLSADRRVVGSVLAEAQLFAGRPSLFSEINAKVELRAVSDRRGRLYGYAPLVDLTLSSDLEESFTVEILEAEIVAIMDALRSALEEISRARTDLAERVLIMPLEAKDE